MTINDILNEEIFGNTAIVYRNGDDKFPEYLSTGNYEPGKKAGIYYGKGIYSFLHIEDTDPGYGPILYKCRVKDLSNFFIFDYDEYKKANSSSKATPENFIEEQNKKFNIPKSMYIESKNDFIGKYKSNSYIRNKMAGFVYSNGRNDKGGVLVAFRYYSLIPLAKSNDQGKTWLKIDTTHDYRKNASNLNSSLSNKIVKKSEDIFEKDESGNVYCSNNQLTSLRGAPQEVSGGFDCGYNKLTSLQGVLQKVARNFYCNNNQLTSLQGAPQKVGGGFDCSYNQLISLQGAPQEIKGNFCCNNNQLTSLQGAPQEIEGSFYCSYNQLISLQGAPQKVGGGFDCSNNQLTSLQGAPQKVGGGFDCSYNQLISLQGAPQEIKGNFCCNNNQLTSLQGAPQEIEGSFYCSYNQLTSLQGAPQKIKGSFYCNDNRLTKQEIINYLKIAKIGSDIMTDYGDFFSQESAIEKLSGTIKEGYFKY